jgi:aryl-alcohol dehydrogenase-like predicted oxidoreductase
MRYKLLGRSGLRVSEISLGTMTFGEEWGWGASSDESRAIFDAYAEAGGNFIDTANFYTGGTSEKLVGEFVRGERDRWVIATKYTLSMREGDPNAAGNHRKNLHQAVNASLQRLGTDYIDLLWVHAWDGVTPVDELMRSLDDLARAGKVLYVGISDAPAWVVSEANMMANLRGWSPFVALQIEYSLVQRDVERDLLPMARARDLAVLPWSPLGQGILTGKYSNRGESGGERRFSEEEVKENPYFTERNLKIADEVVAVAGELGVSPSQVALAWLRQQPGVVIPIIGARKLAQVKDNLNVLNVTLPDASLRRLDDASRIELGFPHDFLTRDFVRDIVFSGQRDNLDVHRPG